MLVNYFMINQLSGWLKKNYTERYFKSQMPINNAMELFTSVVQWVVAVIRDDIKASLL